MLFDIIETKSNESDFDVGLSSGSDKSFVAYSGNFMSSNDPT